MVTTLVRGACPLDCQDSCGWRAHVSNGKVLRVEGDPDHPYTRGSLCAKVHDFQTRTYADDRLLHPLRRTGRKGEGQFERVSWDDAIAEISTRFQAIIDEHGAEALLPFSYLGSLGVVQQFALRRLFHALGATRLSGSVCGQAGNAITRDTGTPICFDPEELAESELIVLWGCNSLTTAHHSFHFMEQARKNNGARIIAIDPRLTRTAKQCDQHIAIMPGTDSVLAMALVHVLLDEDLADLDYAREVSSDLDALISEAKQWSLERAAGVCGVDPETIRTLARDIASARPATLRPGINPQQSTAGEAFLTGLSALAILGGHWRHRGGGLLIEAYPESRYGTVSCPAVGPQNVRSLDMSTLGEHLMNAQLHPQIHGMMSWCANPVSHQVNSALVQQGLAREDLFLVVIEHFMTDTARYGDIVLPATTQLEHFDIVHPWGHHYLMLNEQAVPPEGESKSHGEIMRLIAGHMGLEEPALHESDEVIAASVLPPDLTLEELRVRGWVKRSPPRAEPGPSRKVSIAFTARTANRPQDEQVLQLLTPKSHYFINSTFANMPRHRGAEGRPSLEMHPDDASRRGLSDGDTISVSSENGAIDVWLRVTDEIRPGVVALPGKWWRADAGSRAVVNELTPNVLSAGGQPAYNDTFVRVSASVDADARRAGARSSAEPLPSGGE